MVTKVEEMNRVGIDDDHAPLPLPTYRIEFWRNGVAGDWWARALSPEKGELMRATGSTELLSVINLARGLAEMVDTNKEMS